MQPELPIIQRTYDLILWYVPWLNKLPRDFKFVLGERVQNTLYGFLEALIRARYRRDKLALLESLNSELDARRFEHASRLINEIGENLGGWIKQQKSRAA